MIHDGASGRWFVRGVADRVRVWGWVLVLRFYGAAQLIKAWSKFGHLRIVS